MDIWPTDSTLRRAGDVVAVMKTLAVVLVAGGIVGAIIEATASNATTAVRDSVLPTLVGGVVFGSLWAWLGYVLEALMGIWLATSDMVEYETSD